MSEYALTALYTTLVVSISSLAVVVSTGVPAAYLVGGLSGQQRRWVDALLMAPMVLPPTVVGFGLLWLLGRQGPFGLWLQEWFGVSAVFTKAGAVLAAAVVSFPLLYRSARAAFSAVDPTLLDASRTLGRGELSTFLRVCLPLARKGLVAGSLLALVRAMGEFGATLMVAGNIPGRTQTMPLAIFEAVQAGRGGDAMMLCVVAALAAFTVVLLAERVAGERR